MKALIDLVDRDENNEVECGKALEPFASSLPGLGLITKLKRTEFTHSDGRCDLIVVVKQYSSPADCFTAHIWELKSPAKYVFTLDASKTPRFIPTHDLIDAETQLFWYIQHFRDTNELANRYKVKDVQPGGIIIGRQKTLFELKGDIKSLFTTEEDLNYCKMLSFRCRVNLLYGANVRLLTWDDLVVSLAPTAKHVGETKGEE